MVIEDSRMHGYQHNSDCGVCWLCGKTEAEHNERECFLFLPDDPALPGWGSFVAVVLAGGAVGFGLIVLLHWLGWM